MKPSRVQFNSSASLALIEYLRANFNDIPAPDVLKELHVHIQVDEIVTFTMIVQASSRQED